VLFDGREKSTVAPSAGLPGEFRPVADEAVAKLILSELINRI
jgi:hypothetical protein